MQVEKYKISYLKLKDNWNNRFHLGQVPKYNALEDKNFVNIKRMRHQFK